MYDGGISIETYSAGAGRDVASMLDNEHLKCTATLPLYITSESAVSRTNFSALLLPLFHEKKLEFFSFHVVVLVKTFPLNYQCRTDIDEAQMISALQHKSKFNFQL